MSNDSTTAVIRVLLVDDHAVVRAGLAQLLATTDDIDVVGQAGTIALALEKAEVTRPDVVVLDITLGDDDSLESLPELLRLGRDPRVLILSMHDDVEHLQAAFAAGAHGYLIKDAATDELVEAIHALHSGARYVHPVLGARLAQAATAGPSDDLTDRERDVVRLLALGHTNQDVAAQLFLSVRTVETHRAHALSKLRLQSRAELVRWALDHDLLS